jgi:HEAT repeat protein
VGVPFLLTPLLVTWLVALQSATPVPAAAMKADVARLVAAAESRTDRWPRQAPPPLPEVTAVASHGLSIVPLLTVLLSDTPDAVRDPKGWKIQQQVALALCRIYSETAHCGRVPCEGDPPERIRFAKTGWMRKIAADEALRALPHGELLARFKGQKEFSQQMETGRALADTGDRSAIRELEPWLAAEDRHLRGNAAFVLARLGDSRGFDVIAQILADRSPRPVGQGIPIAVRDWSTAQIAADRYYAAHLLGDLKDRRGVPLLIRLLDDPVVRNVVPWSLAEIGDARAIGPLLAVLDRDDPSMRVIAISALERLNARAALPRLNELLVDHRMSNFGERLTVAEAARHAIAVVSSGVRIKPQNVPIVQRPRTWPFQG